MLNLNKLKASLSEFCDVYFFDSINSTSTFAKEVVKNGASSPFLVVSREQSQGRGRQGKSFFSPKDTGLYFTLALPYADETENHLYITSAAAVAIFESIYKMTGKKCLIKWVNDLYFEGRKISGILTETAKGDTSYILIGIGINLTTEIFPDELSDIATSLMSEVDENALVCDLVKRLFTFWENPKDLSFMETYRKNNLVPGRPITFIKNNVVSEGIAVEIEDNGALLVKTINGIEILDSGEITLKL